MESKKINQLATELAPELSDLTIIGDPTTGISKKITLSQMASLFTGTVEEYASLSAFPLVGAADTIYIALDTNIIYRWNTGTSAYVELSPNIVTSLVFNDANGFDGTISLVGSTATLTITTALTTGSVGFIGASGALLEDNANFFWNNSTKRLGINTNAPTTALDVFGSGIIGRVNGTSTNNAFIGFASAGTNKWSIGNVQSDHRFRIYSEANTSELISVLQTGQFGIGIANPTTKLHIDGGASALIANLDADVSVAKSISFRSDNSARINLEVSGTESGSNAGMNFYLRTYTDAGALLATPLTITRSTGDATFSNNVSAFGYYFSSIPQGSVLFAGASKQITQNQPKFYWDDTNYRLGIGTNTPQRSLHIVNASDTRLMLSDSAVSGTSGLYLRQYGSKTAIVNQSNDIFQLGTNDTYFMTATTAGNIGFNTDTPNRAGLTSGITVVTIAPASTTTERWGALELCGNRTAGENQVGSLYFTNINTTNTAIALIQAVNGSASVNQGSLLFYTNGGTLSEKGRFTGSGFFKVSNDGTYLNTTSPYHEIVSNQANNASVVVTNRNSSTPYGVYCLFNSASPNDSTRWFYNGEDSTATRFTVRSNGGIANYQANNANLSDERTKKEIFPLESYWNKFKDIEIVKFKYKDQTHDDFNIGVIAQQIEKVAPEFVDIDGFGNTPEDGIPYKTIYTADLHHATIKVLQEAMAKIEILEAKLNAK